MAGAGAGVYAASLITGFEPGVGGVANGLVGAVGMGYVGMHGTYALTGKESAEDRIGGAVLSIMGGAAGLATGAVLGDARCGRELRCRDSVRVRGAARCRNVARGDRVVKRG